MHEIVTLSVTSFRGSIGGEHYYGRLHVRSKMERVVRPDGSIGHITRSGYNVERHPHDGADIKRTIDAKEAAYLNKKDDGGMFTSSMGLVAGDETIRFNDVASVMAAAVEAFATMFDQTDVLICERMANPDEIDVLVAPENVRAAIADGSRLWDSETWLMENGYLVKNTVDAVGAAPSATDDPRSANGPTTV